MDPWRNICCHITHLHKAKHGSVIRNHDPINSLHRVNSIGISLADLIGRSYWQISLTFHWQISLIFISNISLSFDCTQWLGLIDIHCQASLAVIGISLAEIMTSIVIPLLVIIVEILLIIIGKNLLTVISKI